MVIQLLWVRITSVIMWSPDSWTDLRSFDT